MVTEKLFYHNNYFSDNDNRPQLQPVPGHREYQHNYVNASYIDVSTTVYTIYTGSMSHSSIIIYLSLISSPLRASHTPTSILQHKVIFNRMLFLWTAL